MTLMSWFAGSSSFLGTLPVTSAAHLASADLSGALAAHALSSAETSILM